MGRKKGAMLPNREPLHMGFLFFLSCSLFEVLDDCPLLAA